MTGPTPAIARSRITVAGAGAIGSVVAASLAEAGHEVSVVARGATRDAIRQNGVGLDDLTGRRRHAVLTDPDGPQDVLFLCAKAPDLEAIAVTCQPLIAAQTLIVPLVNGVPFWFFHGHPASAAGTTVRSVDPTGRLAEWLPFEQVIGAIVFITATTASPGFSSSRTPHRIILGEPCNGSSDRVEKLGLLLRAAAIDAPVSASIRDPLWIKLLANVTSNLLSVLTGATLEHMFRDSDLRTLIRDMATEVIDLAHSYGAAPDIDPARFIAMGETMGPFKTSMLQDYERGRALEIGSIGDAILELGARNNAQLPATAAIVALARFFGNRHTAQAN